MADTIPTLFKESTNIARFSPRKAMRTHLDPALVRENKLKKKSEREKSIKISGIRLFNPEAAMNRSPNLSTHQTLGSGRSRDVKYESFGIDQINVQSFEM